MGCDRSAFFVYRNWCGSSFGSHPPVSGCQNCSPWGEPDGSIRGWPRLPLSGKDSRHHSSRCWFGVIHSRVQRSPGIRFSLDWRIHFHCPFYAEFRIIRITGVNFQIPKNLSIGKSILIRGRRYSTAIPVLLIRKVPVKWTMSWSVGFFRREAALMILHRKISFWWWTISTRTKEKSWTTVAHTTRSAFITEKNCLRNSYVHRLPPRTSY